MGIDENACGSCGDNEKSLPTDTYNDDPDLCRTCNKRQHERAAHNDEWGIGLSAEHRDDEARDQRANKNNKQEQ